LASEKELTHWKIDVLLNMHLEKWLTEPKKKLEMILNDIFLSNSSYPLWKLLLRGEVFDFLKINYPDFKRFYFLSSSIQFEKSCHLIIPFEK